MTSYSYTLNFKDGGKVVLKKALEDFKNLCQKKQASGELVPYTAYEITVDNLLEQIKENVEVLVEEEDDGPFGIFKEIGP